MKNLESGWIKEVDSKIMYYLQCFKAREQIFSILSINGCKDGFV